MNETKMTKAMWSQKKHSVQQRCTTLLGQGPQSVIFSALEGRRQNYELYFRKSSIKNL